MAGSIKGTSNTRLINVGASSGVACATVYAMVLRIVKKAPRPTATAPTKALMSSSRMTRSETKRKRGGEGREKVSGSQEVLLRYPE